LPIWFDFGPAQAKPATYDGVFWEIEPTGEYLFFLAGNFLKNEKGLLRFRTAPVEVRSERCFEGDVISVAQIDGSYEQDQALTTAGQPADLDAMTLADAVETFVPAANALGFERWVIANRSRNAELHRGVSRLALGRHFHSGVPYAELIDERLYLAPDEADLRTSVFRTTTWSDDPLCPLRDLIALHNRIAEVYADMPFVPLGGATRM